MENMGTMGILKTWSKAMAKSFGKKAGRELMGDVFKTIFHSALGEGNEEFWTSLGQDFSSYATGVNPDAMKGLTLQQSLRKLGYIKISDTPIEEHIRIDLEQYAKENGYIKLGKEELIKILDDGFGKCICSSSIYTTSDLADAIINARG